MSLLPVLNSYRLSGYSSILIRFFTSLDRLICASTHSWILCGQIPQSRLQASIQATAYTSDCETLCNCCSIQSTINPSLADNFDPPGPFHPLRRVLVDDAGYVQGPMMRCNRQAR